MKNKVFFLIPGGIGIVAALCLFAFFPRSNHNDSNTTSVPLPESGTLTTAPLPLPTGNTPSVPSSLSITDTNESELETRISDEKQVHSENIQEFEGKADERTDVTYSSDPEERKLQELLDANNDGDILAQADKMSKSSDKKHRLAAIDAFSWVGGADAALSLVLLAADEDPEVAAEAEEALDGTLEDLSDLNDDEEEIVWDEVIRAATTDGVRDAYLLALSGQDQTISIPILLNFLEDKNTVLQEAAKEYLEFVTQGETITTREEGEAWLKKYEDAGGEEIFQEDLVKKE